VPPSVGPRSILSKFRSGKFFPSTNALRGNPTLPDTSRDDMTPGLFGIREAQIEQPKHASNRTGVRFTSYAGPVTCRRWTATGLRIPKLNGSAAACAGAAGGANIAFMTRAQWPMFRAHPSRRELRCSERYCISMAVFRSSAGPVRVEVVCSTRPSFSVIFPNSAPRSRRPRHSAPAPERCRD